MPMRSKSSSFRSLQNTCVHAFRVALLIGIFALIHLLHARSEAERKAEPLKAISAARIESIFGPGSILGEADAQGGTSVCDSNGNKLGSILQTSPESDSFLGFSGSTNLLVAFDLENRIREIEILSSSDTRDHVNLIERNPNFLHKWVGLTTSQFTSQDKYESVTGATLTSLAIVQGLRKRLGAKTVAPRFPEALTLDDAKAFFPSAKNVSKDLKVDSLWHVQDQKGNECGLILRTSPSADDVIGYQGPTDAKLALEPDGKIVGLAIGKSFDNEPYVSYTRQDRSFAALLKRYKLDELRQIDLENKQIEGVSGATMTSMAVVRGLIKSAESYKQVMSTSEQNAVRWKEMFWRVIGTSVVVGMGLVVGLTRLRGYRPARIAFQCLAIVYLGFMQGELLSVAMFAGWAQNGVPWQNAAGLLLLSLAAVLVPIFAKTNIYCSHICPHGAVQQMLPRSFKRRRPLPNWLHRMLSLIRPLLIVWILIVLFFELRFNLVDLEAFDAYIWRATAWPSIAIAVGGILFSFYVPMAYCQHGCVTGGLLQYVRRHSQSHRLRSADYLAIIAFLVGLVLVLKA
jgi:NosR/NirI family transcriptional regulator, nitrous oxide reductase regulator